MACASGDDLPRHQTEGNQVGNRNKSLERTIVPDGASHPRDSGQSVWGERIRS